jgi:hypothetical protein
MHLSGRIVALMAAAVLGAATSAVADDDITGELLDNACLVTRGPEKGRGPNHANCSRTCAQKGQRLVLRTTAGVVYYVTGELARNNNAALVPLLNKTIVLKGNVRQITIPPADADDRNGSGDGRRGGTPPGTRVEIGKRKLRKDDFREGDALAGDVLFLEAKRVERIVADVSVP